MDLAPERLNTCWSGTSIPCGQPDPANPTQGNYFRADNAVNFRKIYDEIDQLEKTEVEINKYQRFRELYPFFVLSGLAILLLEVILSNTVWRRLP